MLQEAAISAPLASAEDSSALASGDAAPSANGHARCKIICIAFLRRPSGVLY